ncbi:NAD(P)H-dependent oxidoreductase [Aeromonas caviae]|uniref:NAD(P)H-dependent oxidoreductase n=1 Tax=Aeromonas caviae TaxID=648 RepID=UPI001921215C|nr:NAD(P)H-dependent oxidoreductase [Aeromonas caviae]
MKTLVIVSHPYPGRSVLTKRLQDAAETLEGVNVCNLEILYGYDTSHINGDTEREIMREHTRIVFLFPTHWFNITPVIKACALHAGMIWLPPLVFENASRDQLSSYLHQLIERLKQ